MSEAGYTPIQAMQEATRCLMCADAPCTCECPAGVDARAFIRKIRFDNLAGAVRLLRSCNVLAGSCAYICPTGTLCAGKCTSAGLSRSIDIGGLQRYVMEWERRTGMIEPRPSHKTKGRVAVVGSGPAGLGCAAELAVRGYDVTVFEKHGVLGGMLTSCIPDYRLPPEVVAFEIEFLKKLGISFVCHRTIDDPKQLLADGFRAVFLGTGLDHPRGGELVGSDLSGTFQALDLLAQAKRGKLPELGRRVVVIGGGDTALDAARVARRSGSECFILYRRTQREMPAYPEEVDEAWNEGVEFYFRVVVQAVVGHGKVEGVRCVRVRWSDAKGGRRFEAEAPEFLIACDAVVIATGQGASSTFGLRTTPKGLVATDRQGMTSERGIFAAGDLVMGGGTAARAVGAGKLAAGQIDGYLAGERR